MKKKKHKIYFILTNKKKTGWILIKAKLNS